MSSNDCGLVKDSGILSTSYISHTGQYSCFPDKKELVMQIFNPENSCPYHCRRCQVAFHGMTSREAYIQQKACTPAQTENCESKAMKP